HQLIDWNAAVVEQHFARVARAHAELVFFPARCHAGRAAFDDEGGDSLGPEDTVRHRHHDHDVADVTVRRERLRAVDGPAVAGPYGGRPHAGGVAARGRLGQTPGANLLTP